jgi:hypothetical protein
MWNSADDPCAGLSILVVPAYSRAFPENNFQSSTRIAYSRILVLLLQVRYFQGFQQNLAGVYPENEMFSPSLQHDAVMMTPFSRSITVSRAAARCNNRSLVASEL